jgi:hypothetical protein
MVRQINIPDALFATAGKLQELIKEVENTILEEEDMEFLMKYMSDIRAVGVTPGKVGERCLGMAEDVCLIRYPGQSGLIRQLLAVKMATEATTRFGIHSSQRQTSKKQSVE